MTSFIVTKCSTNLEFQHVLFTLNAVERKENLKLTIKSVGNRDNNHSLNSRVTLQCNVFPLKCHLNWAILWMCKKHAFLKACFQTVINCLIDKKINLPYFINVLKSS